MAVTPVGNMTYINQNSQVGSVQQANTQVKLDFQSMVNLQQMQEKQEEIQEVRPPEKTLGAKDEREGDGKREKDEEGKEEKNAQQDSPINQEDSDIIQTNSDGTIMHLDISI